MTAAYDHRASIIKFMDSQADKYESNGLKNEATALRATASSIKAQMDTPSRDSAKVTSPAVPIIMQAVNSLGGCYQELMSGSQSRETSRVRFAAIWAVKKRFGWSNETVGAEFDRDPSSISHAVARAEALRGEDEDFRRVTDALIERDYHCPHCLAALSIA